MAASCADDAQDDGCCLIVLDPKRDLADKALSVIPRHRRVWILDLAEPEIGINPLLIPGRPDAVADAVVEGFRDTNEDGAIMASSDRYLRQAAIGALVLAREERRMPTMGDLYRLLLPHEETMRRRVAELCDTHAELAFTSVFFGESLPGDLKDARSQTTVKLDAPRNKIEALLGVPSVNRMLHHPFQRSLHEIIAERDVLVVRGASGSIGEGNAIKVLTWLLRCLDAALSDQQQKPERDRVRVALKVDEAHLLLSPTFARMLAVHRSAGLEAMCAWQQLSQIKDLAVREATTNLLQNRFVFRMNNPEDARAEIGVMMSAYTDLAAGLARGPRAHALSARHAGQPRRPLRALLMGRRRPPRRRVRRAHHPPARGPRADRPPRARAARARRVRRRAPAQPRRPQAAGCAATPSSASDSAPTNARADAPAPVETADTAIARRSRHADGRATRGPRSRADARASRRDTPSDRARPTSHRRASQPPRRDRRRAAAAPRAHRRRAVRPGPDRRRRPARGDRQPAGRHPHQPRAQLHRARDRPAAAAQVRARALARRREGAGPRRRARQADPRRAARGRLPARPADRPALLAATAPTSATSSARSPAWPSSGSSSASGSSPPTAARSRSSTS